MTTTAAQPTTTGYICKRCGAPSPVGVGYASSDTKTADAAQVTSCECGYSVKAVSA